MKPVFLIDYDYTLFDAKRYKEEVFFPILSRTSQLDIKTVKHLYKEFIDKNGYLDLSKFSVVLSKKQKETIGGYPVSAYDIKEEVTKIDASPYLNEWAPELIEQLRELGPVVIFSQGDVVSQSAKMARSGILDSLKLKTEKPILRMIPRFEEKEKEERPELIAEILNKRFTSVVNSVLTNEAMVMIDPDKINHSGELAVRLIDKGYSPWIIDDKASVLINAYETVNKIRPKEQGQLNLIFMDQGPYAKKHKPTSLPDMAYHRVNNLKEGGNLILKRVQGERGIPPVTLS